MPGPLPQHGIGQGSAERAERGFVQGRFIPTPATQSAEPLPEREVVKMAEPITVPVNTDKMTTYAGLLTALPHILALFGVAIPGAVVDGITALGLSVLGWLSNKK